MAGQPGDPGPFGRRAGLQQERDGGDDFDRMREQMEKERENFFRGVNPRDWPNESTAPRGGLFSRPRSSLGAFPRGFPAEEAEAGRHRQASGGPAQEEEGSDHSSSSGQGQEEGAVPIHVLHERAAGPRHRYSQARNTTELPAKVSAGGESPRLERAASEPPNKFTQRLNLAKPSYHTIPEGGEGGGQGRPVQLQDPRGPEPTRPGAIKPSASAPSVPTQESQPVPPPRRSPPRPAAMAAQPGLPTAAAGNVRHIPIFVEGRPEPIFNTNLKVAPAEQPPPVAEPQYSKPSDFYPAGVQRARARDAAPAPEAPHFQGEALRVARPAASQVEPTTPIGPPPGPIPMGYTPATSLLEPTAAVEPTTPQGPPPGPIPMGYLPTTPTPPAPEAVPPPPPQRSRGGSSLPLPPHGSRSPSPGQRAASPRTATPDLGGRGTEPAVNVVPIQVEGSRSRGGSQEPGPARSPAPAQQPEPPPHNSKVAKLDKIKEEVDSLMEKIKNFSGTKQDKEYLYLDEMLTRHLIALDGIEPEGQPEIRHMRKESIKSVNLCLSLLDERCAAT